MRLLLQALHPALLHQEGEPILSFPTVLSKWSPQKGNPTSPRHQPLRLMLSLDQEKKHNQPALTKTI